MTEEFALPTFEALLAGTLALMTGYAQAAQADIDPSGRLAASRGIAASQLHCASVRRQLPRCSG